MRRPIPTRIVLSARLRARRFARRPDPWTRHDVAPWAKSGRSGREVEKESLRSVTAGQWMRRVFFCCSYPDPARASHNPLRPSTCRSAQVPAGEDTDARPARARDRPAPPSHAEQWLASPARWPILRNRTISARALRGQALCRLKGTDSFCSRPVLADKATQVRWDGKAVARECTARAGRAVARSRVPPRRQL